MKDYPDTKKGQELRRRAEHRYAKKMAGILRIGTLVNYHAVIGEGVTSGPHACRTNPFTSASGDLVVFLEGKTGYVLCAAVSLWEGQKGAETGGPA
jgi:hypothetical protein